jgi:hypothetical protein
MHILRVLRDGIHLSRLVLSQLEHQTPPLHHLQMIVIVRKSYSGNFNVVESDNGTFLLSGCSETGTSLWHVYARHFILNAHKMGKRVLEVLNIFWTSYAFSSCVACMKTLDLSEDSAQCSWNQCAYWDNPFTNLVHPRQPRQDLCVVSHV